VIAEQFFIASYVRRSRKPFSPASVVAPAGPDSQRKTRAVCQISKDIAAMTMRAEKTGEDQVRFDLRDRVNITR